MSTPGSQRQVMRDVLLSVHKVFEVPDVRGESRSKQVSQARLAAYMLAREMTRYSLPELGEVFHRDHSTVYNGIQSAKRLMKQDSWFADQVKRARDKIVDLKRARLA